MAVPAGGVAFILTAADVLGVDGELEYHHWLTAGRRPRAHGVLPEQIGRFGDVDRDAEPAIARVDFAQWLADCPAPGCNAAMTLVRGQRGFLCGVCFNWDVSGRRYRPVAWPDRVGELEAMLLARRCREHGIAEAGHLFFDPRRETLESATALVDWHHSWTTPKTYTVGAVLTASELNTYQRDNLLEAAPAKVTTKGDVLAATGANAIARVAVGADGTALIADAAEAAGVKFGTVGVADRQTFTGSGTWTRPSGLSARALVLCRLWGPGGGGGGGIAANANTSAPAGAGGGGGPLLERWFLASDLGATEDVTIGAGGVGGASDSSGAVGGNTTFGSWATAYSGGGGRGDNTTTDHGGGGGGGTGSDGATGAGGNPASGASGGGPDGGTSASKNVNGGGGGGGGVQTTVGHAEYGGAGGGGIAPAGAGDGKAGGSSIHGGAGGGGGGGRDSSNNIFDGGAGGSSGTITAGGGGAGGSGHITTPVAGSAGVDFGDGGGGGGAISDIGVGGAGGDGATAGGGGGGGAGRGSGNGGPGGDGGDGYAEIITFD